MPEISRFYGIIVQMFFKDHNPPHFHIIYGEYRAVVTIADGLVDGKMPSRALKMVFEWLELHRDELMANWELVQKCELPIPVEPLK